MDFNNPEICFALQAVRQAALLVRQVQDELVPQALQKGDRSPVTIADFASQALVGKLLSESYPGDVLIAEEDSSALRSPEGRPVLDQVREFTARFVPSATPEDVCRWIDLGTAEAATRFWTLDPIDGTKGFLRGDQYAVALALVDRGQVQIGVLGCPNLIDAYRPDLYGDGSLVVAARGQGTWTASLQHPEHFEPLHVSQRREPSQARILRSVESGHTHVGLIDEFASSLAVEVDPVSMDSQAKYAVLAAGKGDLLLRLLSSKQPDYKEKIWDQAAGSIILEEAGGQITDLHGRPLDFTTGRSLQNNRGILASNGHLHAAALHALQAIGA